MEDNTIAGLLMVVVVVIICILVYFSALHDGMQKVAEFACIEQGFDTGEWIDGAIQCISHTVIGP